MKAFNKHTAVFGRAPLLALLALVSPPLLASSVDLSIRLSDSLDPVQVGDLLIYDLLVSNSGPDVATGTQISFETGGGLAGLSSNLASCAPGNNLLVCDLGDFAPGSLGFEIRGQTLVEGVVESSVVVSSLGIDEFIDNNSDTESTTVEAAAGADLAAFISATPDPVAPGGRLDYSVSWLNFGPEPTSANGLVAMDPGFSLLDFALLGGGPGDVCSFNATSNILACALANLAVGTEVLLNITGLALDSGLDELRAITSIDGDLTDGAEENNIASVTSAISSPPVSAVPIPAAAWLFGSALFGLIAIRRRQITFKAL